jgi:hypothetical protein
LSKADERGNDLKILFPRFFKNMKFLCFSFLAIVLLGSLSVIEAFSQILIVPRQNQSEDWSALFPEIPNCERVIQPLTLKGGVFEQVAMYKRENYKNNKNENYFGCGSITLRFEPSARKAARQDFANSASPLRHQFQMKGFDAYSESALCGNDDWRGSTTVYFDEDKVLIVSAYTGAEKILEFAKNVDYELKKKQWTNLSKTTIFNENLQAEKKCRDNKCDAESQRQEMFGFDFIASF